jgi:hypothetical protein
MTSFGYSTTFATIFFSFIAQDIPVDPKRSSGRILIFTTCLTGAFLLWSYSASLISFLTIENVNFPIKSFQVRFFTKLCHLNIKLEKFKIHKF